MSQRKAGKKSAAGRQPLPAEDGEEAGALYRLNRSIADRCEAKRRKEQEDSKAAWEEIRLAVARGEITREELFGQSQSEPIRLTIGTTVLEVRLTATISEAPAHTEPPAKPAKADAITFRALGGRTRRPK